MMPYRILRQGMEPVMISDGNGFPSFADSERRFVSFLTTDYVKESPFR